MSKTLFVGNGVNRVTNHSASWTHVLKALIGSGTARRELEHLDHKPFALVYEEILLAGTSETKQADEIGMKKRIADLVSNLRFNDYHRRIVLGGIKHILTTNYDYGFENASGLSVEKGNLARETKYSVFRRKVVNNTSIWHIHGEAGLPSTITLGYDQYSGYLQKLREHATGDRSPKGGSPFKRRDLDFDSSPECVYSWLDVFFRDDVHIIGLGLDYTEIDLWWALTYKARLKARGWPVGETHYHDWHVDLVDERCRARHSLLRALSVEVHSKSFDSYAEAYDQFIQVHLDSV
jgi:hypothetical protein